LANNWILGVVIAGGVMAAIVIGNNVNENRNRSGSSSSTTSYTYSYIDCVKQSIPSGIGSSVTYEQAFNRYFEDGKWSVSQTSGGDATVVYTGIYRNDYGQYVKADIYFSVTKVSDDNVYINPWLVSINDVALLDTQKTEFIYNVYGVY